MNDKKVRVISSVITFVVVGGMVIGVSKLYGHTFPFILSDKAYAAMRELDSTYDFKDTYWTGNLSRDKLDAKNRKLLAYKNKRGLDFRFRTVLSNTYNEWYDINSGKAIISRFDTATQMLAKNYLPVIRETRRTLSRQYRLLKRARERHINITHAEPPYSNHIYGLAADIYWYDTKNNKYLSISEAKAYGLWDAFYNALKTICNYLNSKNGTNYKVGWGGTWSSFKDYPHYEMSYTQFSDIKSFRNALINRYVEIMKREGYACDDAKRKCFV